MTDVVRYGYSSSSDDGEVIEIIHRSFSQQWINKNVNS